MNKTSYNPTLKEYDDTELLAIIVYAIVGFLIIYYGFLYILSFI